MEGDLPPIKATNNRLPHSSSLERVQENALWPQPNPPLARFRSGFLARFVA
jgi:hypothetical protein